MADRVKIVDGLEKAWNYIDIQRRTYNGVFKGIEVNCFDDILTAIGDAVELLKAQEPRVMTLEEYKVLAEKPKEERDPVWEEWPGLESTWAIPNQAYGGYGTSWRCWTSRPTEAEREAAPWND